MPQTTMILKNARIYTMDGRIAEAAAITGDRIAKVGSNQEIKSWEGKLTQVIDLGGRTVVPGFNDSHTHLVGYGNSLRYANLKTAFPVKKCAGESDILSETGRFRRESGYSAAAGIRTSFREASFRQKRIWTEFLTNIRF